MVEFKVFLRDRTPLSVLWSRTLIFQFPVLVPVVVFSPQRTAERIIDIPVSRTRDGGGLPP